MYDSWDLWKTPLWHICDKNLRKYLISTNLRDICDKHLDDVFVTKICMAYLWQTYQLKGVQINTSLNFQWVYFSSKCHNISIKMHWSSLYVHEEQNEWWNLSQSPLGTEICIAKLSPEKFGILEPSQEENHRGRKPHRKMKSQI